MPVFALECTGTVKAVKVWGYNKSLISISLADHPGPWIICDLNKLIYFNDGVNILGAVSDNSCSAMYSIALSALVSSKEIRLDLKDYSDCMTIPSWNVDVIDHVNIVTIANE
jgi:hypothetical protein